MKKILLALLVIGVGSGGCALTDGYELGDGTRVVFGTRTLYCNLVPADVRQAALERMQSEMENYPDHSICDVNGYIIDVIKPVD